MVSARPLAPSPSGAAHPSTPPARSTQALAEAFHAPIYAAGELELLAHLEDGMLRGAATSRSGTRIHVVGLFDCSPERMAVYVDLPARV